MNKEPLVMCLTNYVAADFTANALLAIGARPAMVEEPSEAAELAAKADAVLINLGTVHPRQAEAMRATVNQLARLQNCKLAKSQTEGGSPQVELSGGLQVNQSGNCQDEKLETAAVPWVLDPVACHLLSYRGELAKEFLAAKPTLIRANHSEIDHLMGTVPEKMGSVPYLSTGEVDRIGVVGTVPGEVPGGVPMLQTVTATGCTQGAICAAFLGRGQSPLEAAENASRLMKRAGEMAWEKAKVPGSFKVALIDALYNLSHRGML